MNNECLTTLGPLALGHHRRAGRLDPSEVRVTPIELARLGKYLIRL